MDYSPPDCSVHEILQAVILEWVAMPSSRVSCQLGLKPMSLASPELQADFLPTEPTWEAPRKRKELQIR